MAKVAKKVAAKSNNFAKRAAEFSKKVDAAVAAKSAISPPPLADKPGVVRDERCSTAREVMGAPKVTPSGTVRAASLDLDLERALVLVGEFEAGLCAVNESSVKFMPQSTLATLVRIDRLSDKVGGVLKTFKARALAIRDAGGTFEPGRVAVAFKEQERRNPAWKDEAVARAQALAAIKGEPFEPEAFVKSVQAKTEPSVSRSVDLVVSGE